MDAGSKAIKMINELGLYSNNEALEEVATNEIKYMLLPAFMGYFTTKKSSKDHLEVVKQGKEYFTDFLRMCKSYNVVQSGINIDDDEKEDKSEDQKLSQASRGPPDLMKMMGQREDKIRRYKEQKELEKKLKELEDAVKKENVDDEIKREYYTLLLKKWVSFSVEAFDSLNCEETMLEIRNQSLGSPKEEEPSKKEHRDQKPFRPFIITKDIVQKKIFGAGYPSLPLFTIEEFYEQRLKDGTFKLPDPSSNMKKSPEEEEELKDKEDEAKENKLDNPDELQKARDWDDWKDDHRRGWGNRQNMG